LTILKKKYRPDELHHNYLPVKRPRSPLTNVETKEHDPENLHKEISNIKLDTSLTFKDATKGEDKEQWLEVINSELEKKNLYTNNIMTFVKKTILLGKKPISTKWVFNIKKKKKKTKGWKQQHYKIQS